MRAFLFLSAFFLSAIGFVVAAPAADTAGHRNSGQIVSDTISTTVAQLEPLTQKFGKYISAAINASNLDTDSVNSIVSQIDTVISQSVQQMQASVQNDGLVQASVNVFLYDLFIGLANALSVIPVAGPILYTTLTSVAYLLYFAVPFGPNQPDSAATMDLVSGSLKAIAQRSGAN